MIRRVKAGYRVLSERTKRNLGTYPTLDQAKERLRQVEFFKRLHQGLIKPKLRKKSLLKGLRRKRTRRS